MAEKVFADGMGFKKKRDGAPDFVKGSVWIKVDDFIPFLQKHKKEDGFVNLDLLKAKEKDSLYFSLNDWKPENKDAAQVATPAPVTPGAAAIEYPAEDINPSDIPF